MENIIFFMFLSVHFLYFQPVFQQNKCAFYFTAQIKIINIATYMILEQTRLSMKPL